MFLYFLQAEDIFRIHEAVCPNAMNENTSLQVSCDGVRETKSTSVSLDVYSSKFTNCKNVYPHVIVRPLGKYKNIDNKLQLKKFIDDICESGKKIEHFLGDNQKRCFARDSQGHQSYHPCEYCYSKGVPHTSSSANDSRKKQFELEKKLINEKLQTNITEEEKEELKALEKNIQKKRKEESKRKNTRITWPASTANGEPRTRENTLEIVENIDNLSPNERKGIVGRSVFLDIPGFKYVSNMPAEYLHSVCLGIVKRLVELTFAVGEVRIRITKRKLSQPSEFNVLMASIKTAKEFPRRARDLDFSVLKGVEFRNLTLFFFPLIIECIEEGEGERELWLYLSYMIRACIIPSPEFRYVDLEVIDTCCKKFYKLYEALFGYSNCTYNTHVVLSHLIEIRCNGPLTETSTFPFESFYGEMKNCFVAGTGSPLKQIFKKILLKRSLAHHCCNIPIHFSDHETSLENDTLIYVWQNNIHNMYVIKEICNTTLICNKIDKERHDFDDIPTIRLDWHKVGVYKKVGVVEENVEIEKENVTGKVIKVGELLMTCPNNVLREK